MGEPFGVPIGEPAAAETTVLKGSRCVPAAWSERRRVVATALVGEEVEDEVVDVAEEEDEEDARDVDDAEVAAEEEADCENEESRELEMSEGSGVGA